jgi:hypothetical protein
MTMSATCTNTHIERSMTPDLIIHPDDIKKPETGAPVDAYFVVSVGQTVGIFYSW